VPFYVQLGRTKTFEVADIARIRAHIRRSEQSRLKSIGVAPSGIVEAQLAQLTAESVLSNHFVPKTRTSRRVRLPKSGYWQGHFDGPSAILTLCTGCEDVSQLGQV